MLVYTCAWVYVCAIMCSVCVAHKRMIIKLNACQIMLLPVHLFIYRIWGLITAFLENHLRHLYPGTGTYILQIVYSLNNYSHPQGG